MVNEPRKVTNLNAVICRVYVNLRKNSWTKDKGNLDPPSILVIPSRNHETSSVMVQFMKGVHDDIRITFSNFYQGMVRPYHGTTPGVMFFKHLIHFPYSCYPVNYAFMVDYSHTFP